MASFGFEVAGTAVPRGVDAGIGVEAGLSWTGVLTGVEVGRLGAWVGTGTGVPGVWRA